MAKVLIDSGPITATYPLRYVPQEKWRDLMLARRAFLETTLSYDCRCLVEFCNDAALMHAACGFDSAEAMIRDGYGLEPAEIGVAIEWLKLNPPSEPVSLNVAVTLGKRGGDRRSEKAKADQVDNVRLKTGGNSRAYILARLDRDGYSELAERVRAGATSANAAAIEAGYRKRPIALELILKLLAKLTPTERLQLRARLDEYRSKNGA